LCPPLFFVAQLVISNQFLIVDIKELLPDARENVSLAEYTTFKIGGPARYFFEAGTRDELIKALKAAQQNNLPFFILGGGSNVLFSDEGFKGMVINIKFSDLEKRDSKIYAEAGVKLSDVVNLATEKGLTGLEWAAGIYGAIGGAVRGNAGAFGKCIADILEKAEVVVLPELAIRNFSKDECQFGYRESIFKKDNKLIILSALFGLKPGDRREIKKEIKKSVSYRKEKQPLDYPSAGSVFKNPEFKIISKTFLKDYPDLKKFSSNDIVPAGFLIERAGLKGKRIGDAKISEKHCNFIINVGKATAKDVLSLMKLVKEKVKDLFGVELEEEIMIVE